MGLGVMAMKGYFTFPKVPELQKHSHGFESYPELSLEDRGLTPLQKYI